MKKVFVVTHWKNGNPVVAGPVAPVRKLPERPMGGWKPGSTFTGPNQPPGFEFADIGEVDADQCFTDLQSLVDHVFGMGLGLGHRNGAEAERKEWIGEKPAP